MNTYNSAAFTIALATAPGADHTGAMLWLSFVFQGARWHSAYPVLSWLWIHQCFYLPSECLQAALLWDPPVLLCWHDPFFSEKDKPGALYPPLWPHIQMKEQPHAGRFDINIPQTGYKDMQNEKKRRVLNQNHKWWKVLLVSLLYSKLKYPFSA